jgi:hypothetical protein
MRNLPTTIWEMPESSFGMRFCALIRPDSEKQHIVYAYGAVYYDMCNPAEWRLMGTPFRAHKPLTLYGFFAIDKDGQAVGYNSLARQDGTYPHLDEGESYAPWVKVNYPTTPYGRIVDSPDGNKQMAYDELKHLTGKDCQVE